MDLNHARLPIPPLRLTSEGAWRSIREVPVFQTGGGLSIRADLPYTVANRDEGSLCLKPGIGSLSARPMNEPLNAANTTTAQIPEELALEIRKLAHELSNALEIIVQTSFLLGMAELKEPASDWLRMLDGGVQKALDTNLQLREYIKKSTPR